MGRCRYKSNPQPRSLAPWPRVLLPIARRPSSSSWYPCSRSSRPSPRSLSGMARRSSILSIASAEAVQGFDPATGAIGLDPWTAGPMWDGGKVRSDGRAVSVVDASHRGPVGGGITAAWLKGWSISDVACSDRLLATLGPGFPFIDPACRAASWPILRMACVRVVEAGSSTGGGLWPGGDGIDAGAIVTDAGCVVVVAVAVADMDGGNDVLPSESSPNASLREPYSFHSSICSRS